MSNEIIRIDTAQIAQQTGYEQSQVQLAKDTLAKGASDEELLFFLNVSQRCGLDPFAKQIYLIKRFDKKLGRDVYTPQTSIDGYRAIADRTGTYVPGREPTFEYDADGNLVSATSYIKKLAGGQWHEVAATAFYEEYVQRYNGQPTPFWRDMPRNQLAKCAEALALRRAFPAHMSGVYTADEMQQADTVIDVQTEPQQAKPEPQERGLRGMLNAPASKRDRMLQRLDELIGQAEREGVNLDWLPGDDEIAALPDDQLIDLGKSISQAIQEASAEPVE